MEIGLPISIFISTKNEKMKNKLLIFLAFLPVLLSSKCKKDYYTGTENVRLKADFNNTNEVLNLGDTLKVTLTIPNSITSESGVINSVSSVQEGLYNFTLYQIDTVTRIGTRIRTTANISVSKGSIDSYLASVYVSTNSPFNSVLNIIPTTKGIYYVQITGVGSLKINNSYQSFLKVKFNTLDIHNAMMSGYLGTDFGNSMLASQNNGIGIYGFKVY